MLWGRPVEIHEVMPARGSPETCRSPLAISNPAISSMTASGFACFGSYSNKPYVMFYCTKRVGGGVLDPGALRVLKLPA